jgi:hypothetical protein
MTRRTPLVTMNSGVRAFMVRSIPVALLAALHARRVRDGTGRDACSGP